jgi:hypothetical protein
MLIVVKIFLIALAVFGQVKLFPEHAAANHSGPSAHVESSLDSVVLPEEKPELALAQRAMEAQGLCHAEKNAVGKVGIGKAFPFAEDTASAPALGEPSKSDLATNCF